MPARQTVQGHILPEAQPACSPAQAAHTTMPCSVQASPALLVVHPSWSRITERNLTTLRRLVSPSQTCGKAAETNGVELGLRSPLGIRREEEWKVRGLT